MKIKKAYITLMSVLIIGAVAISLAVFLIFSNLDTNRNGLVFQQTLIAENLVSACAEKALREIRLNSNYLGINSIFFENGNCQYEVLNLSGQQKEIRAVSFFQDLTQRIKVNLNLNNSQIEIVSWQKVANF